MLNYDLIHLVNSGDSVAFVGTGPSCEAGIDSWATLYARVEAALSARGVDIKAARRAREKGIPGAFDALRREAGTDVVDACVRQRISAVSEPGRLHKAIADWPFRFYITTNYDHLLDKALQKHAFVPVGNSVAEIRKLAGGPRNVVWHPHGGADLTPDKSLRLVLSQSDYDEIYHASPTLEALRSITQRHRLVFFGFGFNDAELLRVFEAVKRVCSPASPAYAFLGQEHVASSEAQALRDKYRADFNVEVIPYNVATQDHARLHPLLDAYSPFLVRRSISLGQPYAAAPEYDPTVTCLQVHITLADSAADPSNVRKSLRRAAVLASLKRLSPQPKEHLIAACLQLSDAAGGDVLAELASEGLIVVHGESVSLGPGGKAMAADALAAIELARDQFAQAMSARVSVAGPELVPAAQERVARLAMAFAEELARTRGLAVAQNMVSSSGAEIGLRTTALMQALPAFIARCADETEAFSLIDVVAGMLTSASTQEAAYLGHLTQAFFGQQVLGMSEQLRNLNRTHLSNSVFVLDAGVLIRLLANGCIGNHAAVRLATMLRQLGAVPTTTHLFAEETREHANWAVKLVQEHGENSIAVLDAARGARGYGPNMFLDGFVAQSVGATTTLRSYLEGIFGTRPFPPTRESVERALADAGVVVQGVREWSGCDDATIALMSASESAIREQRQKYNTFKHDRQTRAEAESVVLVAGVRDGKLTIQSRRFTDAFFVSPSTVIEGLPNLPKRIGILPEGLTQWLWSAQPLSESDAAAVFDQLLYELAAGGIRFVPREHILRRFSGVIGAGQEQLHSVLAKHRDILLDRYGHDPEDAFKHVGEFDAPFLAKAISEAALEGMKEQLARARIARADAEANARLGGKDREELLRLRSEKKARQRRNRKREARHASDPKANRR